MTRSDGNDGLDILCTACSALCSALCSVCACVHVLCRILLYCIVLYCVVCGCTPTAVTHVLIICAVHVCACVVLCCVVCGCTPTAFTHILTRHAPPLHRTSATRTSATHSPAPIDPDPKNHGPGGEGGLFCAPLPGQREAGEAEGAVTTNHKDHKDNKDHKNHRGENDDPPGVPWWDKVKGLYDVVADPRETQDLQQELPAVVQRLHARLMGWNASRVPSIHNRTADPKAQRMVRETACMSPWQDWRPGQSAQRGEA